MIGRTIADQYRIIDVLGEGGMGVVYLAEDLRLRRTVALKALSPRVAADRRARRRLEQEARAVARLSHPGIAAVYALEEDGPDLFVVSEHVPGTTLGSMLREGPVATERLLPLAVELADALAAAHARGVVHRDVSPANVLVTSAGHAKLLDFGIARVTPPVNRTAPARLTGDGRIPGTARYMSPEQLQGQEVDARSDIFSLGVLLYEAATGRHPFERPQAAATIAGLCTDDPPPLGADLLGGHLEPVIFKCLEKRPDDRYGSMTELLGDLRDVAAGLPPSSTAATGAGELERRRATRSWWTVHQLALCGCYGLSLLPMWRVREWAASAEGAALFFAALALAVVATTRRAHLWFTAGIHPGSLAGELSRSARWLPWLDRLQAIVWLSGALLIGRAHNWWAVLLVVLAVGVLTAGRVIEPATTRAAFAPPDRHDPLADGSDSRDLRD